MSSRYPQHTAAALFALLMLGALVAQRREAAHTARLATAQHATAVSVAQQATQTAARFAAQLETARVRQQLAEQGRAACVMMRRRKAGRNGG